MPRPRRLMPRLHSDDWPDQPCTDAVADVARLLAVNLRQATGGRTIRELSRLTGVDHSVIGDILRGETWSDLATIARLEIGLGVDLWPSRSQRRA